MAVDIIKPRGKGVSGIGEGIDLGLNTVDGVAVGIDRNRIGCSAHRQAEITGVHLIQAFGQDQTAEGSGPVDGPADKAPFVNIQGQ